MDAIDQRLHAVGEFFRVGDEVAVAVAPSLDRPAIVDDDVFVAAIFEAAGDNRPGRFADGVFVDFVAEHVPRVPPHRGSGCQGFG